MPKTHPLLMFQPQAIEGRGPCAHVKNLDAGWTASRLAGCKDQGLWSPHCEHVLPMPKHKC